MARILPFAALRPAKSKASGFAALPYDVYDEKEAREAVKGKTENFLCADRPETQFPEGTDPYSPPVYEKANALLEEWEKNGVLVREEKRAYYVYELTMDGRTQTGIAALSSVDDYLNDVCKKHENTVAEKEADRIRHVDVCSAQTGPIFLAYRGRQGIRELVEAEKKNEPLYDVTFEDGVRHRIFRIDDPEKVAFLKTEFEKVPSTYIADGHHRAASAVRVSEMRRKARPDYTGEEEFNFFLSVLFPEEELLIMDYNRVVLSLNGLSPEGFLSALSEKYDLTEDTKRHPDHKGSCMLFFGDKWYRMEAKKEVLGQRKNDPVSVLDVSFLQEEVLEPVLGIEDPRRDKRIRFVGGIRGLEELERLVREADTEKGGASAAAFAMYPTEIGELLAVADASLLMPPKSTWFEPKLRSGFLIHTIER